MSESEIKEVMKSKGLDENLIKLNKKIEGFFSAN